MKATWEQQTEDTDADGMFLEGEAAMRADLAFFAEQGAPDTETATFLEWEATDRDAADISADVSVSLAAWLIEFFGEE